VPAASEPLVIGYVTMEGFPGGPGPISRLAAQAAVEFVNRERGGVRGRPVALAVRDEGGSPEAAAACAREIVAAGAFAVMGMGAAWAHHGLPILEAAGVPWLGGAITGPEYTSPVSFPIIGGVPAETRALARYFGEREQVRRAAVLHLDVPEAGAGVDALLRDLADWGVGAVATVPLQLDLGDLDAAATRVTDHRPEAVFAIVGGDHTSPVMHALRGHQLAFLGTAMDIERILGPAGDAAVGSLHCAEFLPYDDGRDPEVAVFRDAMDRYTDVPANSWGQGGFAGVMTICDIAARLEPVAARPVLEYLRGVDGQPVFMGSSMARRHAPAEFPQLTNVDCLILRWDGTRLVDAGGDWVNGWAP
jgi:branched-chain amino acid transport system substrate-binding protein